MDKKLRVADVSYGYDTSLHSREDLLRQHFTTVGCAEALARQSVEVKVFKRFHESSEFEKNGVSYIFHDDGLKGKPESWQITSSFHKLIAAYGADIIHVHGMVFPIQVLALRFQKNRNAALVVQHQGGRPLSGIKRLIQKSCISVADAFFFTTKQQGEEWLGHSSGKILPVMEGSNSFAPVQRHAARSVTGMEGDPVFLWVGTLDENKDPFTVLKGFEWVAEKYPGARLYMIFSSGELLASVKEVIYRNARLHESVVMLGRIEPHSMERYYNSADYFVLGSHYEGSGYSLSEALACGCIPVVTDIPSFRMMTDDGRLGALWEPENEASLVRALEFVLAKERKPVSEACSEFFRKKLSFDAIATETLQHYHSVLRK